MIGWRNRTSLVIGILAGLLAASVQAEGHDQSDWYGQKWRDRLLEGVNGDKHVEWRFVEADGPGGFPIGDGKRLRVEDGAVEWNPPPATMGFHRDDATYPSLNFENCSSTQSNQGDYQKNRIGWQSAGDTDELARMAPCTFESEPDTLYSFKIRVNSQIAPNWWSGTGMTPSNEYDLWSAMAHEFGHATGFYNGLRHHWPEADSEGLCPEGVNRHTMCPGLIPGTIMMRNLEEHDSHTYNNAYP